MKTRKNFEGMSRKCVDLYEFKDQPTFKHGILPTTRDVLELLIYEPNWGQKRGSFNRR